MNRTRDPEMIIATWLDDGPAALPSETRRAIVVGLRTQPRVRGITILGGSSRRPLARLAAAAIVLAVGGSWIFLFANRSGEPGSAPSPSPTPGPSARATPSATATPRAVPVDALSPDLVAPVPALTSTFVSAKHGYSVRYPADWAPLAATMVEPWQPAVPSVAPGVPYDYLIPVEGIGFRAASTVIPAGAVVDDWIGQYLTQSNVVACAPPRSSLDPVTIDGHAGRLRGFCDDAKEVEATVVVGDRVYLFTLFLGGRFNTEAGERELFTALLKTIRLNPADAQVAPSPASP